MNLISVIVGVGLVALVVTGGIQYVSPDAATRSELMLRAEAGFAALESALASQQAVGLRAPSADGWQEAMFPTFGTLPPTLAGLNRSYGNDEEGVWFCLSGRPTMPQVADALKSLKNRMSDTRYALGDECASHSNVSDESVAATVWMQRRKKTSRENS